MDNNVYYDVRRIHCPICGDDIERVDTHWSRVEYCYTSLRCQQDQRTGSTRFAGESFDSDFGDDSDFLGYFCPSCGDEINEDELIAAILAVPNDSIDNINAGVPISPTPTPDPVAPSLRTRRALDTGKITVCPKCGDIATFEDDFLCKTCLTTMKSQAQDIVLGNLGIN